MAYPLLREKNIDVGTGPLESACKNVTGERLKIAGARWAAENAEAMGRLRALAAGTAGWEGFWKRYRKTG